MVSSRRRNRKHKGHKREPRIRRRKEDRVTTTNPNTYQPGHKEGNLFSYPAAINANDVEGFNEKGVLRSETQYIVPDTNAYRTAITFCNAKSISSQTKKSTTPGEATKTLNFFEGAWNSIKNFFTDSKFSALRIKRRRNESCRES